MSETTPHESLDSGSAPDPNAAHAEKRRLSGVPLLIVAIGVVLFVQALFVISYVDALHHPKPHDVAFGVVGASPVPIAVGKQFSLKTTQYASESAARTAIDQRKIDGAFVAGPEGATLIVAPAASPAGASALSTAFGTAAAALGQKMEIVQVHPLPPGDAGGTVSFLVVMALIVGGYLSSTIAMAFGGRASPRRRLASLAIAAVIGALLTDTLAGPVLDALPTSKFLVLWALFTLVMMAVAFSTSALQTLLGAAGTLVVVVVFVIFGAPASGRHGADGVPARHLADLRPVSAGRSGNHGGAKHDLLRRQRDRDVADRARRLSRRRRAGRDPPAAAAPTERRRGRGRGVRRVSCGRVVGREKQRSMWHPTFVGEMGGSLFRAAAARGALERWSENSVGSLPFPAGAHRGHRRPPLSDALSRRVRS